MSSENGKARSKRAAKREGPVARLSLSGLDLENLEFLKREWELIARESLTRSQTLSLVIAFAADAIADGISFGLGGGGS